MNESKASILLALKKLSCSQKDLAIRFGVSPAQISKWKKGEAMSLEMEEKFRQICGITNHFSSSFVYLAGSKEDAQKWNKLFQELSEIAVSDNETGYNVDLTDSLEPLHAHTFDFFEKVGIKIPENFPQELESIINEQDTDDEEFIYNLIEKNLYTSATLKLYKAYIDIYGFYCAYMTDLHYDLSEQNMELSDKVEEIYFDFIDLAATKVEIDSNLAPKINDFRLKTTRYFEDSIKKIKEIAYKNGVPLRAELMHLVHESHDYLSHEAERESFGFNASQIHPDIYMNELLVGMRIIHQVLPKILEKLEINDFELDETKLTNRT